MQFATLTHKHTKHAKRQDVTMCQLSILAPAAAAAPTCACPLTRSCPAAACHDSCSCCACDHLLCRLPCHHHFLCHHLQLPLLLRLPSHCPRPAALPCHCCQLACRLLHLLHGLASLTVHLHLCHHHDMNPHGPAVKHGKPRRTVNSGCASQLHNSVNSLLSWHICCKPASTIRVW